MDETATAKTFFEGPRCSGDHSGTWNRGSVASMKGTEASSFRAHSFALASRNTASGSTTMGAAASVIVNGTTRFSMLQVVTAGTIWTDTKRPTAEAGITSGGGIVSRNATVAMAE